MTNQPTTITPEIYEMITGYVNYFCMTMPDLVKFNEKEDLVQDVVVKFIRHDHIAKYNPEITSMKYHVMNAVKNTLIDILRKEKYRRTEVELDRPITSGDEGEALTLADTVASNDKGAEDLLYLAEMMKDLSDRSKEWGPEMDIPFLGKAKKSAYNVYLLVILGFKKNEISEMFGFTGGRVSQLFKEAESTMIELGYKKPVLSL